MFYSPFFKTSFIKFSLLFFLIVSFEKSWASFGSLEEQMLKKITTAYIRDSDARNEMEKIKGKKDSISYLLSYPRSGNSWMRYCLEFLTHRPTCEACFYLNHVQSQLNIPFGLFYDIETDMSLSPIIKVHSFQDYSNHLHPGENNTLVCLVRNPMECILSHNFQYSGSVSSSDVIKHLESYMEVLCVYDTWPHNKIMIYYEDMIKDLGKVLMECVLFFQGDPIRVEKLLNDKELHKQRCLKIYEQHSRLTRTKGNSTNFYEKNIEITGKEKINEFIFDKFPTVSRKYLSRYLKTL